jgi:hypothetical protein
MLLTDVPWPIGSKMSQRVSRSLSIRKQHRLNWIKQSSNINVLSQAAGAQGNQTETLDLHDEMSRKTLNN